MVDPTATAASSAHGASSDVPRGPLAAIGRRASGVLAAAENAPGVARVARLILVVFVFATFAAVSFNGFYQKWGLRDGDGAWDGDARYSFAAMIEGEADKPFVYRQLLPKMANGFEAALPEEAKVWMLERLNGSGWWEVHSLTEKMRIAPELHDEYLLRYYVVYYACVAFMFAALFVMREICRDLRVGEAAATIAPCLFALVFVYFMSMGGFFYDFPEVFFMALAALLAMRGRWLWLVPLTAVATYNKEVFLVFTVMLFPFLRANMPTRNAALVVAGLVGVAGVTHLLGRIEFADNPGGSESWLRESILFYADPRNLFAFEVNFGVVTPRGYSLFTILAVLALFVGGWRKLPQPMQQHVLLAPAINLPLVLVFCGPGEVRNFSLCFIALLALIAQNVGSWVASADTERGRIPA